MLFSIIIIFNCYTVRVDLQEELLPSLYGLSFDNFDEITASYNTYSISTDLKNIYLYGTKLNLTVSVSLSKFYKEIGNSCDKDHLPIVYETVNKNSENEIMFTLILSDVLPRNQNLFLCLGILKGGKVSYHYSGSNISIIIQKHETLPKWASILICSFLILCSGLFSGLNLGLMSLTPRELLLISSTGTNKERQNAVAILPLRRKGNILLCSILLGNTIVNTSTAILLENITSGIISIVVTTSFIVIFGEVIPQSICAKYGLYVGAKTRYFTWMVIFLTFPISYPLGKLLDCIMGKDTPVVYNRHQLLEMVRVNCGNIEADEVAIIQGALKFKSKRVSEIMTPLDKAFMVEETAVLDFQTMSNIVTSGYSRIPVYSKFRSNVIALLHIKDIILINPEMRLPLKSILNFYNHTLITLYNDTTLAVVFNEFKKGLAHLGIVVDINQANLKDSIYEAIGVVSLEDILEEIIQTEIVDETDTLDFSHNVFQSSSLKIPPKNQLGQLLEKCQTNIPNIGYSLQLNIVLFLSSSIEPFSVTHLSHNVLHKMISHPGVVVKNDFSNDYYLYKEDVTADYFILLLEGRVEMSVGSESQLFYLDPFSYYGVPYFERVTEAFDKQQTIPQSFISDITLRILSKVVFLRIPSQLFIIGLTVSKIEKSDNFDHQTFDHVWDKYASECNLIRDILTPPESETSKYRNIFVLPKKDDTGFSS